MFVVRGDRDSFLENRGEGALDAPALLMKAKMVEHHRPGQEQPTPDFLPRVLEGVEAGLETFHAGERVRGTNVA